jgi:hypothetical protein
VVGKPEGFSNGSPSSKESRLGRSGIRRIEVRPSEFFSTIADRKFKADRVGDPDGALRPEQLFADTTPDGARMLSLLVDTVSGRGRLQILTRWMETETVEIKALSGLWPSLKKLEIELAELHRIRWLDADHATAWPGGPRIGFVGSAEGGEQSSVASATGGHA